MASQNQSPEARSTQLPDAMGRFHCAGGDHHRRHIVRDNLADDPPDLGVAGRQDVGESRGGLVLLQGPLQLRKEEPRVVV